MNFILFKLNIYRLKYIKSIKINTIELKSLLINLFLYFKNSKY